MSDACSGDLNPCSYARLQGPRASCSLRTPVGVELPSDRREYEGGRREYEAVELPLAFASLSELLTSRVEGRCHLFEPLASRSHLLRSAGAEREAQLRTELTAGLTAGLAGAPRREADRRMTAAHDAYLTMAMSAGAGPEQQQQAARAAAGKLKKHVNDIGKKRKCEHVAGEREGHRAERRV